MERCKRKEFGKIDSWENKQVEAYEDRKIGKRDNEKTERLKDGLSERWIWKMGEWNYGIK
jgi:hypothetical protein